MVDPGSRDDPHAAATFPSRRVVLLGASNLVSGLTTVVEAVRDAWGRPLDILAAIGHGRSYGTRSRVLVRELPGIIECGLWDELSRRAPAPTAALVTDVGNDILYGATPGEIAGWVDECLARLGRITSQVVLTELPLDSLNRVGRLRFLLLRTLLFPTSRLTYETAIRRAHELNDMIRELSRLHGGRLFKPRSAWYDLDPIHIRRRFHREAWQAAFSCWDTVRTRSYPRLSLRERWRVRWWRPQRRWLCGVKQDQLQPAGTLHDGTTIALY